MTELFLRPALTVLFGLSLAGCAAVGSADETRALGGLFNPASYSADGRRDAGRLTRGASPVAALPAAAGRVIDVREKRYGNGFSQEITLAADAGVRGENIISVHVRDQPLPHPDQAEIEMPRDRDDEIAAEIAKRFEGASLRLADAVASNAYGPYGLASGRVGAANCVFMWQSLNDLKPFIRTARVSPYKIEVVVRVRLCRGGASLAQLAHWAGNLILDTGGVSQPALGMATYAPAGGDPVADALAEPSVPRASAQGSMGPRPSMFPEETYQAPFPVRVAAPARSIRRAARPRVRVAAPTPAETPRDAYAQPVAAPPATAYGQPGQVVWTQPGAHAIARSAAPGHGVAASGALRLPPQAFSGPGAQTYVAPR